MKLLLLRQPAGRKILVIKTGNCLVLPKRPPIFAVPKGKRPRGISSAGSEHLPYKQRVTGSNPVFPTLIYSYLVAALSKCFHAGTYHGANKYIRCLSFFTWEVSSVGLERLLHTPEVEGSNPLLPTPTTQTAT